MRGCLLLLLRRVVRRSRDRTETGVLQQIREDGSTRNGIRLGGAPSLLGARPFSRTTQLCGFQSEPGFAFQTNKRRFDGEVLIQFMLLDCRKFAFACFSGKSIHALEVGLREPPTK